MAYYHLGNTFKWFVARTVDIKDPHKLGRVKIRIIHDQTGEIGDKKDNGFGLDDDELLWAWPISAIQSASLARIKVREEKKHGLEEFDVPDWIDAVGLSPTGIAVGTYVFGFYLDGHEQNIPMIFGTYHKMSAFPEPDFNILQKKKTEVEYYNDVAGLAREVNTLSKKKEDNRLEGELVVEPESAYNTEYPYNTTYTTKSGHVIELDDTPGSERIHIWHRSGSYIEINKDGRSVTRTVGDDYEIVTEDKNVLVKGNVTIEVHGDTKILTKGNSDITTEGNSSVLTKGNSDITTEGNSSMLIKGDSEIKTEGNSNVQTNGNSTVITNGTSSSLTMGPASITSMGILNINALQNISITSATEIKLSAPRVKA